jgi:hypothetical protein
MSESKEPPPNSEPTNSSSTSSDIYSSSSSKAQTTTFADSSRTALYAVFDVHLELVPAAEFWTHAGIAHSCLQAMAQCYQPVSHLKHVAIGTAFYAWQRDRRNRTGDKAPPRPTSDARTSNPDPYHFTNNKKCYRGVQLRDPPVYKPDIFELYKQSTGNAMPTDITPAQIKQKQAAAQAQSRLQMQKVNQGFAKNKANTITKRVASRKKQRTAPDEDDEDAQTPAVDPLLTPNKEQPGMSRRPFYTLLHSHSLMVSHLLCTAAKKSKIESRRPSRSPPATPSEFADLLADITPESFSIIPKVSTGFPSIDGISDRQTDQNGELLQLLA